MTQGFVNFSMMRHLAVLLLCLPSYHLSAQGSAQNTAEPVTTIGEKHIVQSKILNEARELWIKLPPSYNLDDTTHYPVVYLLDARANFMFTTSLLDQLKSRGIPQSIVVGIVNTERARDLTPSPTLSKGEAIDTTIGQAGPFLNMLASELIPWVEERYRTHDYRTIVGHSYGGLFALYALAERPELFRAYLAISPSLWWDNQGIVRHIADSLDVHPPRDAIVFMSIANERGLMMGGVLKLAGYFETKQFDGLRWNYKTYPAENHGSIPVATQLDGFTFIYQDWDIRNAYEFYVKEGTKGIEARAAKIKAEFGQSWMFSNDVLADVLYQLHEERMFDQELELATYLLDRGHNEVEYHEAAGRSLRMIGREEEALPYYLAAYQLNPGYPSTGEVLDSLKIDRVKLPLTTSTDTIAYRNLVGRYEGTGNTAVVTVKDGLIELDITTIYSHARERLSRLDETTFYIPKDGYYTARFSSPTETLIKADRLTIRYVSGERIELRRTN